MATARKEGFVPKQLSGNDEKHPTKKVLVVIGIMTTFGRKKNRDAIRKAWMPTGTLFSSVWFHLARPLHISILSILFSVEASLGAYKFQDRLKFCSLVSDYCDC